MLKKIRAVLADVSIRAISGVIAGAILAGGVGTYLTGLWPTIADIASKIGSLGVASTLVPNWLLALICLLALLWVYARLKILYHRHADQDWRDYREDSLSDIVWRWRYNAYNGGIEYLTPFCPRCDTQLLPAYNSSMPYHPYRIVYHCRHCDFQTEINKNQNDILTDVSLEIERNLRQMGR